MLDQNFLNESFLVHLLFGVTFETKVLVSFSMFSMLYGKF